MLVYTSKKHSIGVRATVVVWSSETDELAVGAEDGVLRIFRLSSPASQQLQSPALKKPVSSSEFLVLHQELKLHSQGITCVSWNNVLRYLASADSGGQVVVWMTAHIEETDGGDKKEKTGQRQQQQHQDDKERGVWQQHMTHKRSKGLAVSGIEWSPDGTLVAMTYEDGVILMGSSEGDRLWEEQLREGIRIVRWSHDSQILLICIRDEVIAFDSRGT